MMPAIIIGSCQIATLEVVSPLMYCQRLVTCRKATAVPKLKTPPSEATSQYPAPSGVVAMPTIGALRVVALRLPR